MQIVDGDDNVARGNKDSDFEKRRGGRGDFAGKIFNHTTSTPDFPFPLALKERELEST